MKPVTVSHTFTHLIQSTLNSCKPPTGAKELKLFNKALDGLTTINENLINRASKVVLNTETVSDYDDVYLIS